MSTADPERTRFIEEVILAQEEERRRIALELHDQIGQSLTSLSVRLKTLAASTSIDKEMQREVEVLREITSGALEDVGRLARGLRPALLDELGLGPALEKLVSRFSENHGVLIDCHLTGFDKRDRLPSTHEITLYRVVQEALTNIVKHAHATTASVVVERKLHEVRVIVEDDGVGLPEGIADGELGEPTSSSGSQLGLQGIRERVALLSGRLVIESLPNQGTALYISAPIQARARSFAIKHRDALIALQRGTLYIGRSAECEISLEGTRVSRKHARMVSDASGTTVEDLGSTNGVFVNHVRIQSPTRLRPGDTVTVGGNDLVFIEATERSEDAVTRRKRTSTMPVPRNTGEFVEDTQVGRTPSAARDYKTQKSDALELAGSLATRMLSQGRIAAAERALEHHLLNVLQNEESRPTAKTARRAAFYASKLAEATRSRTWVDYVLELYATFDVRMPTDVEEWLVRAARTGLGASRTALDGFLAARGSFGPAPAEQADRVAAAWSTSTEVVFEPR